MIQSQPGNGTATPRRGRKPRQRRVVLALFTLTVLISTGITALMTASPASAAPVTSAIAQCNGSDNVGGEAVACTVTINNFYDIATDAAWSTMTVSDCHGAALAPLTCITNTVSAPELITSVAQCDGSGNGGGGEVRCSVTIVNTITGAATATPVTVNQCNDSGTGGGTQPTMLCDPVALTTSPTVNECNGSGNGGGGTVRVNCTVQASTETAALPVLVDQCNGSGNGGGAVVTCSVRISNLMLPALVVVTPPVVVPPVVVTPPVVVPPVVVTPPVVTPPVVVPPPVVVTPPVVTPPVLLPPVVAAPPVLAPPVPVRAPVAAPARAAQRAADAVAPQTSLESDVLVNESGEAITFTVDELASAGVSPGAAVIWAALALLIGGLALGADHAARTRTTTRSARVPL